MAEAAYGSLPFAEQIAFFRRKLDQTTLGWTDVWQEAHDFAFMVAGANRDDLVAAFRTAVDKVISQGMTLPEFRKDFDAIVEKFGWSYNGGRNWRSRVIYETNLRTSYAAGRFAQLQQEKRFAPYWQYVHSDAVVHPRPQHLAWNGMILDAEDPWWKTHYPPNGWGCQCTVRSRSTRELAKLRPDGQPDEAPPDDMQTVTIGQRSGDPQTIETPAGVDPGFGYTPGRSFLESLSPTFEPLPTFSAAAKVVQRAALEPLPPARIVAAARVLDANLPIEAAIDRFLTEFGATRDRPVVFADATNAPVLISEAFFRTRNAEAKARLIERVPDLLLLADAIRDPDEIWLTWFELRDASGAVIQKLRRRYLRRMQIEGEEGVRDAFVVAEIGRTGWTGVTAFGPAGADYLERQRVGERIYAR